VASSFRIALLSIIVCCAPLFHANAKDTNIILLFGDSIIAGYGLGAEDSVPAKMEQMLKEEHPDIRVINGGVSGDTTAGGRNRLEWTLERQKPDLVILALGGNDVLRGIPPAVTRDNLMAMLEMLKQKQIPTILSAVKAPGSFGLAYSTQLDVAYTQLAEQYGVPLYPFLLTEIFGKSHLMQSDGIHPNMQGAEHIAKQLSEYLVASGHIKAATAK